jgi:acyl-CoA synthetase (NDP forming)
MESLSYLFEPRSVAVIGASDDPGKYGHRVMESIIDAGFEGPVYPINPNLPEVLGRKTYPSTRDLPEPVELAFVVIPARAVLGAIRDCIAAGVKAIVIITAGFSEIGKEGLVAEAEIARLCKEAGVPAVGPNCMGVVCFKSHIIGTMTMDRLQGEPGDVSFISQSGTYGITTLNQGVTAGVGFSKFVSSGNEAVTKFTDYLEYFGGDPETRVVIGYIESLKDADRFVKVASEVSKKKPVVVMKFGRTDAGTKAAASHTGALAGSHDIYAAAFRQSGVIEVTRTQDLLNMVVAFRTQPLPRGVRIGITGVSGGFAVAASDYLAEHGLQVPELSPDLQQRMREQGIPPFAIVKNPIDLTAEIRPPYLLNCTELLMKSDEVDAVIVGLWSYPLPPADESIRAFERMQRESNKPLLLCYYGSRRGAEMIQGMTGSLPVYGTPEEVCEVMAGMCRYADYRKKVGTFPTGGAR